MKNSQKTKEIASACLKILAAGTTLPMAVLAPNAVGPILKTFAKYGVRNKQKIKQTIKYLERHDLVIIKKMGKTTYVEITENGKKRIAKYDFCNMKIEKPKVWDKKWHIVCFDVPETKKKGRDSLRLKLKELGFLHLQKSVWAHPYPCENEINFISEVFQISPYVWLMEAIKIDHEKYVKDHFDLN